MTAIPSHPPASTDAVASERRVSAEYHAPDDVLPCGTLAGVGLLAISAVCVRLATALSLQPPAGVADALPVFAGAISGGACVGLCYLVARRITSNGRRSASQCAGLAAAGVAAFWPSQVWASATAVQPGVFLPGLLLLAAGACWWSSRSVLIRLASASLLAAVAVIVAVTDAVSLEHPYNVDAAALDRLEMTYLTLPVSVRSAWEATPPALLGAAGVSAALAMLGLMRRGRRQAKFFCGVLVMVAALVAFATDGTVAEGWILVVEPLLLPLVGLVVASLFSRWVLPRERPLLVRRYLSTHRA